MPSRPLPTDIESLQRLVIEQRAALLSRDVEIEKLKIELARLRRMQFGRSSEKLDQTIAQLELTLEELEASESELLAPAVSMPTVEKPKPARRALPESLPRETIIHEAPCNCPACGGSLRAMGRGCR
jgi:transposase